MIPLLLGYLVTYPITPLFISLVVCVMFIFLHNNTSSSLHNLLNVLFLDILLVKRAFYVMILTFIEFKSLEMPFSKNFFFFATHHDSLFLCQFLFFHCFPTHFVFQPSSKPLLVYKRQSVATQNQPTKSHRPQDNSLDDTLQEPKPTHLWHSSRICKPT